MSEIVSITYYDATGRILGVVQCPEQSAAGNRVGRWIDGEGDLETQYVAGGAILDRPVNPATLQGMTLTDIPLPASLAINGEPYELTDAEVELEFDQPGSYRLVLSAWPYLDKEFTVENPTS